MGKWKDTLKWRKLTNTDSSIFKTNGTGG